MTQKVNTVLIQSLSLLTAFNLHWLCPVYVGDGRVCYQQVDALQHVGIGGVTRFIPQSLLFLRNDKRSYHIICMQD